MENTSNVATQAAVSSAVLAIPVLTTAAALPQTSFSAFKEEDRISFIRKYEATVQELVGYRHAIIRYRNTDGKTVKVAQMVTVPALVLPEEYSLLPEKALKVLMGVFEDEQDDMIRSMIEAGASYIGWDNILLEKILDSLTAVRLSQRLTKEGIEAWFKVACANVCTVRGRQIAEAQSYGKEDTDKQIAGTINAYCALAMKLAAPVPNLGQGEATALKNLFIMAQLGDDMSKVLQSKLKQILEPKIVENNNL